jgi:RimJ/RimL family protein N-acetyltransferase
MPEIEIRPVLASDIPFLVKIDHNYTSNHVWQMDIRQTPVEEFPESIRIHFQQVRLPRAIQIEYPRPTDALLQCWGEYSGILVAVLAGQPMGYAVLSLHLAPATTWITDLVIDRPRRQQGIGTVLLFAVMEWACAMESQNLVMEMQPKNYPAIRFALKLGFIFTGFIDRYFANHDIGIFFRKPLH